MKKLKKVDAFGYTPKEFDGWLKGTVKRMIKRAQERESDQEIQTVLKAPRQNLRKLNRQSRRMEA